MQERGTEEEHQEDREMEEEEEDVGDDNNPGDDNLDDAGDEDDGEDGLGGHAKMVAFHAAIKAVLNRQLEKMGQEVRNTNRLASMGSEESEESARELHEQQKKLVLEEDNVRNVDTKLGRMQKKRGNREGENGRFREEVEQLEEEVESRNLAMADLREELNKLSGDQIHLQAQRLQMENQVGVEQACTDKGEEDFRAAQESKAAQDKFIQSLSEEVEQLEGLASQYAAQMAAMDQGTEETMGNVRRAEVEILKVKAEENRMVTNWTNTVLNINKRDEALINFKEGIEARKIELKEVKAKIEGTKNDILGRQAEHEQLTGIFKRVTKLARVNQGTIKRLERQTAEETLELGRLGRVRGESEEVLGKSEAEVKTLEVEEMKMRSKVEKAEAEKRVLEEEVVMLVREQATTERSTGWTEGRVAEVRASLKQLDTEAGMIGNKIAELEGGLASAKLSVEEARTRKRRLEVRARMLVAQEKESKLSLDRTLAAIDKVQNLMEVGNKLRAKLLIASGGEDTSPLEQEIRRLQEETEEVSKYCATTKRNWTKMQNVLIKAHLNKEETVTELGQTKNKLFILQEKKISNENEIRQLTSDLAKLNKQIELFDLNIKKLNTTLADERQKLEQLEDDRSAKSEETFARVADLEEGIEAVKERAKQLEVSRHFVVERVREVDLLVYEWEDKVKAIKETADHLTLERARDSEMETMKSERMKDLGRQTTELISSLEQHAVRREAIYERINAEQSAELDKKREKVGQSVAVRKMVDLENTIKKLVHQIKATQKAFDEASETLKSLKEELARLETDIDVMETELKNKEEALQEAQDEREVRLAGVIQMQSRAKWFVAIKKHQYRLQKREEEAGNTEVVELQESNVKLRTFLLDLAKRRPWQAAALRKGANMLIRVEE